VDLPADLAAIRYEVGDGIARITLDRPQRRNAWTGRMHHEYRWAMTRAEADREVRVIVVTGAESDDGRTAFCVGADVKALDIHREAGAYDNGLRGVDPPMPPVDDPFLADFAFQLGMSTPIVAAVNGAAAGVGLAVVCFADIRFAVTGAKLTTAAPKLGFPAEYGLSWILPRLVGAGRAADWLLSGRVFPAEEAASVGLFSAVHDPGELRAHVDGFAHEMAHHVSPASTATTKRQLWGDLLHHDPGQAVRNSVELLEEMTRGPDFAEGSRALSERRAPEF
jgi:enoyl-CoA hydratase/carnithine racemase